MSARVRFFDIAPGDNRQMAYDRYKTPEAEPFLVERGADGIALWHRCPQCHRWRWAVIDPIHHQWNGDYDRPTITPSLGAYPGGCQWHFFVRDGQIVDAGTPPHGPKAVVP